VCATTTAASATMTVGATGAGSSACRREIITHPREVATSPITARRSGQAIATAVSVFSTVAFRAAVAAISTARTRNTAVLARSSVLGTVTTTKYSA